MTIFLPGGFARARSSSGGVQTRNQNNALWNKYVLLPENRPVSPRSCSANWRASLLEWAEICALLGVGRRCTLADVGVPTDYVVFCRAKHPHTGLVVGGRRGACNVTGISVVYGITTDGSKVVTALRAASQSVINQTSTRRRWHTGILSTQSRERRCVAVAG